MKHTQRESTDLRIYCKKEKIIWKFFLRQMLIASNTWMVYFTTGLFVGSPTVIIPQLRSEANSTAAVSDEMASWLSSAFCYSAIPWVFILTIIARTIGRKKAIMVVCFGTITSYVVFYFSTTTTHLLIFEVLIGLTHSSVLTVSVIVISEFTSPKYRGLFLTLKSASLFWGVWISNAIGTFTHWSYIPMFGFICSCYLLTVFFWPESPYWLASKKRFAECRRAHRWLKGKTEKSEAELDEIIRNYSTVAKEVPRINMFELFSRKQFYMPLLLSILAIAQYHFSGKFVITIYAIEIMKKILGNDKSAYKSMLILDGVTVFSAYVGCFIAKVCKRRTVLLTASGIAITFLYLMALYLYLIKLSYIAENMYVSLFFLGGFCMSISCGPMIMATSLFGELITEQYKTLCVIITGNVFFILHGTLLKIFPLMFKVFTMPGAFLFYGLSSSMCALLVYVYLPETKDKTVFEIEEYFKEGAPVEESKKLVTEQ